MLQASKVKLGVPPAFTERCAVRCTEAAFGPNKSGNPMITTQWELLGYFDEMNKLNTSIKKGEKEYVLGSLKLRPIYFTLTDKAIGFYSDFWSLAHRKAFEGVDENNPDIQFLRDGLVMQAVVIGKMDLMRKQLTDEDKAALIAEGKPAIGEVLKDDEGNPMEFPVINISKWLKPYTGELPVF